MPGRIDPGSGASVSGWEERFPWRGFARRKQTPRPGKWPALRGGQYLVESFLSLFLAGFCFRVYFEICWRCFGCFGVVLGFVFGREGVLDIVWSFVWSYFGDFAVHLSKTGLVGGRWPRICRIFCRGFFEISPCILQKRPFGGWLAQILELVQLAALPLPSGGGGGPFSP